MDGSNWTSTLGDTIMGPWTADHGGKSLIIWDKCRSHLSPLVVDHFKAAGIRLETLPPNMTDLLQVLDLLFNGPFKAFLRHERLLPIYETFQKHRTDYERN